MNDLVIRAHGRVYGVYHNGVLQCYWNPLGSLELWRIASILRKQLGSATFRWS